MRSLRGNNSPVPRRSIRLTLLVAAGALALGGARAEAQTSIRPRVMLMVDTSGSMTEHFTDNNSTGGDGSTLYSDAVVTRGLTQTPGYGLYPGLLLSGSCNNPPSTLSSYDGLNSRMYGAKQAVGNVINAAGEVDWGLMRYTGTQCPVNATLSNFGNACTSDANCNAIQFCIKGTCAYDNNFCFAEQGYQYYEACAPHNGQTLVTYSGTCGTTSNSGSAACATPQTCYADTDCSGAKAGQCAPLASSAAKSCQCGTVNGVTYNNCPNGWTCSANRCVYNNACQSPGGTILVDPSSGQSTSILPYVDGIEAYPNNLAGIPANPELRAVGGTPLAGAARTATGWYNNIKSGNLDAYLACRPYVLVQITDGFDDCDSDTTNGPVAAAGSFVAATTPGARVLNKVYVIGLAFGNNSSPTLNAIAAAGGTGTARLANSQADIEAALADIVSSSVLVEKCNNADDDCNGACDEPFPDVAVTNASCSNRHAANTCDNGQLKGTHCYATGVYVCSADQLSEVCSAQSCQTNNALCPTPEAMGACNGVDDDCNGVVDDCTPFVAGSCCAARCPACNPSGTPQPETCNGCDDDCDGTVDNHLTDTGVGCGNNVGQCKQGTTYCCQEGSPAVGACTQSQVTPAASNPDKLVCLGGVQPAAIACNGCDNNCDGQVDQPAQVCYTGPNGTNGVGVCRGGTQSCIQTVCGGAPTYGTCNGQVTPTAETCNGLDDNCNGVVDDGVTDAWANMACCPTGNLGDCQNTNGGSRCHAGTYQCAAGARACSGAVAKAVETCNGADDDCDGVIDDVAGAGEACTGNGINTAGACRAAFACVGGMAGAGPNGLDCVQTVGPMGETCNGVDDDCDGVVDDNLVDVGGACGTLCPGGLVADCVGQCKAGVYTCASGVRQCSGNVGPSPEVCDGLDNDCDGKVDDNVTDAWAGQPCCATGNLSDCQDTGGGTRCQAGAYACQGGARACAGSVARSGETCNGVDDDCDGVIDDVPGRGAACTGNGVDTVGACTAIYACAGTPGAGPNGLTCTQKIGPMPEICNGIDDDCDGVIDDHLVDVGATCADLCPMGQLANCVGQCKPGVIACVNGGHVCQGEVGPSPEVCDGIDNDCNGQVDDGITDPWANQPCCPTGNLADCDDTNGGTRCMRGVALCQNGMRACTGAVAKSAETCDGLDDDCNGVVDDVAGLGMACSGNGVITQGVCTATFTCNGVAGPGPNGLTCSQKTGPSPEVCDGLDNDCDGVTDDNLADVGQPCGDKCPGGKLAACVGACQPGVVACSAGKKSCAGGVGPTAETCNGIDDDCDGAVDDVAGAGQPCGAPGVDTLGACMAAYACVMAKPGPGPNGLTCTQSVGPMAETCNGIDDDCDGVVDDNLVDVGGACGDACPGGKVANCIGACMAGTYACENGAKLCAGAIGPTPESCNGKDDDCDGIIDDNLKDAWLGMACCPSGNLADCMNTGGGTQCKAGIYQCDKGGRACEGGVARTPEVCNGVDDDCNGIVDDVPGVGSPCTGPGVRTLGPCSASYACTGQSGPGPSGLTCTQKTAPSPELCNGKDDDCDGVVDDNLVDPRVGVVGGKPCLPLPQGQMNAPCDPGKTVCKAGMIACAGEVLPSPDVCGLPGSDCTGMSNNGACPAPEVCVTGMCRQPCAMTEFPCPGGFVCETATNTCIPDLCSGFPCPAGSYCDLDMNGKPFCHDRCMGVVCGAGQHCKEGGCVDCRTEGCPTGQVCNGSPPACVPDPCFGVTCPTGQFCQDGQCTAPCMCASNEYCDQGTCKPNPCVNHECPAGEGCTVVSGMAVCVQNQCALGCNAGTVCCGPLCIADPCSHVACSADNTCSVDSQCNPSCTPKSRDNIVAAGGGGFGCSVASGRVDGRDCSAWAILALLCGFVLSRRRRWLRRATALTVGLTALSLSGCNPNPFCLDCKDGVDGGAVDMAESPDLADLSMADLRPAPTDGPCVKTNNGVEICDGLDNDCDGVVDDVSAATVAADPNNCGKCGVVCDFEPTHQFGACVGGGDGGTPMCAPTGCAPGFVDADKNPANGCEYACTPSVPPTEICDGRDNDCNGVIDDGFGYPGYAVDPDNCGGCGTVCNLPGAIAKCIASGGASDGGTGDGGTGDGGAGGAGVGICAVDHCINDGVDTYRHPGGAPGELNTKGCEYHCPKPSHTVTMGSDDCDTVMCQFDPETCNGVDDDCDTVIDDHLTDTNVACGGSCPGGDVARCVGECKAGTTACTAGVLSCAGSIGPEPELCDGKDNDCDGTVDDDLTDPWLAQACCPSGNLTDCTNATSGGMTGTRCMAGAFACVMGARQCVGGVMRAPETCNGVDDNCNGTVDDVPGIGTGCMALGVNTQGSCAAAYACTGAMPGAGPLGLTCTQTVGPAKETCNGLDDDCDGVVDDNLTDVGGACGTSCPGGDVKACVGACMAGAIACVAGSPVCNGSTGPTEETCNGIDDDCNGVVDDVVGIGTACIGNGVVTAGACTAAYACNAASPGNGPRGLTCRQVVGPKPETCNGVDDDCDGVVDDNVPGVGQACGSLCPGGALAGCVGQCKAGVTQCVGGALSCAGGVGPSGETCNGKDDDCDGVVDDNLTETWAGQSCCPTGNLADCADTNGGTRCMQGAYACVNGGRVCQGGVARSDETCNGIDDDCDGVVDDVPGVGTACTGDGANTVGSCSAVYACAATPGGGPNGLTCTQQVGPMPEVCNGLDDDCDGVVDDNPAGVGGACGASCPGGTPAGCVGQCQAGVTICANGALACSGSTGPTAETCNGKDDDCDGKIDDNLTDAWLATACCPTGNAADCANTNGGTRCMAGAYQCQAGARTCVGGVQKEGETCNGIDDDCNGLVDDIAAIGAPCTGGGTNTSGACTAVYKCTGSPGAGPAGLTCTQSVGPQAETCNGVDDDCDGTVDDHLTDVGGACGGKCPGGTVAGCIGQCKAGAIACQSGVKVCSGGVGPTAETCDGVDNDCNGTVDDGFGYPSYTTDPKNCGACGSSCSLANAVNGCHADLTLDGSGKGVCYVVACANTNTKGYGYVPQPGTCGATSPPRDGPAGIGCNYTCPVWPQTTESCNGKDDDCNGLVDEPKSACAPNGLVQPALNCSTQGVCSGQNVAAKCFGASGWRCDYSGVPNVDTDANGNLTVTEKECDGRDNNCNGTVDLDGFPTVGRSCTAGVGACQSSGTIVCTTTTTTGCSVTAAPKNAVDELCNGIDDNCDGQIDERTPAKTLTCYSGPNDNVGHTCKGYVDTMVAVPVGAKTVYVYGYEASRPGATSQGAGTKTSRACSVPHVLPWSTVTETSAAAACAAVLDSKGAQMRLCTASEWQNACEGPGGAAASKWSMSLAPTVYKAEVCNDQNEAAQASVWATGTAGAMSANLGAYCYTDFGAAGTLADMSGNLSEWTSTQVTATNGTIYYSIRGGSYESPQGGTTCEFNFDIAQPGFANVDVGFRCCADNAP